MDYNDALYWLKRAHTCYIEWGAEAKAKKMWNDLKLDSAKKVMNAFNPSLGSIKHGRDEDEAEELI